MFGEEKIDYKELAVVNYSPRSPKLRFSVFTYLLENKFLEHNDAAELVPTVKQITEYISNETDSFITEADELQADTEGDNKEPANVTEQKGDGRDAAYL